MFYHVWIERKSSKQDEFRLDLTAQEVEDRLVKPYRERGPVAITGTLISVDDIRHLQINKTSRDSHELKPALQKLREGQSALVGNSIELLVATSGIEVTDDFMQRGRTSTSIPSTESGAAAQHSVDPRTVFVVHGRNGVARRAMFDFLRAIGLHPLEWSELLQSTGTTAPYIGQVLDAAFLQAKAVLVLFTPDDEVRLKEVFRDSSDPDYEAELTGQARPNVLFEAGMAMGRNADQTVLVELGELRPFSDVAGRHVVRLDNSVGQRQGLAQRLRTAGCSVNLDGTDWHSIGDFEAALDPIMSSSESPDYRGLVETQSEIPQTPGLSPDARSLLSEAVASEDRTILIIRILRGMTMTVNHKQFGEIGDSRSEARWEGALEELVVSGMVHDRSKDGKLVSAQ